MLCLTSVLQRTCSSSVVVRWYSGATKPAARLAVAVAAPPALSSGSEGERGKAPLAGGCDAAGEASREEEAGAAWPSRGRDTPSAKLVSNLWATGKAAASGNPMRLP